MAKASAPKQTALTPRPVYALVGADSFLQLEKLGEILRLFSADVQRLDVDGERAELADVFDELRSFAMFGGLKLVVMRNADAFVTRFRDALETYLAAPPDSATLVMRLTTLPKNQRVYKLVEKAGQVIPCEAPKDPTQWIIARARQIHDVKITPEAAKLMADLTGDSMGRIDNELAKLALLTESGAIDAATVEANVSFQREQEMWHMTDELARGRTADALRRWRQLVQLDSSTEFRAVTWLAMWLEKVQQAIALTRQGVNSYSIGQQLRIWPREAVEPFVKTANQLGPGGVRRAVDLLAEVDYQSKSGVGQMAENVERFMLSIGTLIASSSSIYRR